jgi:hypothetical protein
MKKKKDNTKIFVHVGLPKAGSTFLQRTLFSSLKDINYSHKRDLFCYKIEKGKINIFSGETYSGGILSPYRSDYVDRYEFADRIHRVHPTAKIILVLRDKDTLLGSNYHEYIKQGGILTYDDWYDNLNNVDEYLDFSPYIKHLEDLFDDVYICNFEDLKSDADSFAKGICDFIGTEVPVFEKTPRNISYTKLQLLVARKLNRMIKSEYNPKGFFPKGKYLNSFNLINMSLLRRLIKKS